MLRNWWMAGLMVVVGVLAARSAATPVVGVVELLVFAVLAVLFSPLAFPRSLPAAETVPTVVLRDEAVVNPEPAWLRDRLRS
ncbi:hypothetical protein [Micromonospora chersina]|uniref:hypothetical protein n=1 Tax=Micromonospora chersina TaxID=47854 RepID=UPI00371FF28B